MKHNQRTDMIDLCLEKRERTAEKELLARSHNYRVLREYKHFGTMNSRQATRSKRNVIRIKTTHDNICNFDCLHCQSGAGLAKMMCRMENRIPIDSKLFQQKAKLIDEFQWIGIEVVKPITPPFGHCTSKEGGPVLQFQKPGRYGC